MKEILEDMNEVNKFITRMEGKNIILSVRDSIDSNKMVVNYKRKSSYNGFKYITTQGVNR